MEVLPRTERPVLVQWLLDTRHLWPEATQTRQLETVAARALSVLLTDEERSGVLRYFHVRDAKMALASLLLKHLAVARCGGVGWDRSTLTRNARTKPVYRDPATGAQPVAFNVSHQAGLVVVAAVYGGSGADDADVGSRFEVGVDVVAPSERRAHDHQLVAEEGGWARFVDMHADVMAPGEVQYLKHHVADEDDSDDKDLLPLDRQLRYFYTLWCLREAYVKMTGEALLAPWLADLEFRQFRPPPRLPAATNVPNVSDLHQHPEATTTRYDIRFHGRPVTDANVCMRSLGDDYMVCTALRSPANPATALSMAIGPFEILDLDEVLSFAEHFRGTQTSRR